MTLRDTYARRTPESHRHRQTLSLSSLLATLVTLGALWPMWQFGLQPIFVEAVAEEAAEEVDTKVKSAVKSEIQPIEAKVTAGNAGLKAVIMGNITALENDISELEYKRDFQPDADWTDEDRRRLLSKQRQLATQQQALAAITEAEAG